ncbi:hypothetical protein [Streptomyces sp. MA15]|uniref:hypothetical protein n=1 Tax=Streptomyces sp. MA15 TaxID=3055061 RepID=UPI0025AFE8BA|nr:hypothetical protein [Streptomyces sp. MA15]MDN3270146.1 hypothetical protein [Streptomyces sp. MA15]
MTTTVTDPPPVPRRRLGPAVKGPAPGPAGPCLPSGRCTEYLVGGPTVNDRSTNQISPGSTAYYFARLNASGVESEARSTFPHPLDDVVDARSIKPFGDTFCCSVPSLDGIIPVGKTDIKIDEWWTYTAYGQMRGTNYDVTSGSRITATATADAAKKQAVVLLGDNTEFRGDAKVSIKGLTHSRR